VFGNTVVVSAKGASTQLKKIFRQYWLIEMLGGSRLLARFNFASDSPKFMHVTPQVSLQTKSQLVSVHRSLHLIRKSKREKKIQLNAFALPRNEWVRSTVVVGDEEQSLNTCVFCRAASNRR